MLGDILNKSNPVNQQKEMSKSEYKKLVDRNTELLDILKEKNEEIEKLNNIINELEKLELYEFTPDYDYDENLVEGYTPFNIREYIQELKGSDKE